MKKTFEINFRQGCPIINVCGHNLLIDLGSPISFATSPITISLGGTTINLTKSVYANRVSEILGNDIEGLIGNDLLRGHNILIDYRQSRFVYDNDENVQSANTSNCFMNYYLVELEIDGTNRRVFLDTGAHISYLDSRLIPHNDQEFTVTDEGFVGHIEARANHCQVRLQGQEWRMPFAELPSHYSAICRTTNIDGVVGKELLDRFTVSINALGNVAFLE